MGDLTADETAEVHKMGREDINPPDRQEVVFMQNEDKEALENVQRSWRRFLLIRLALLVTV